MNHLDPTPAQFVGEELYTANPTAAIWLIGREVPGFAVFDIDPDSPHGATVITWSDAAPVTGSNWQEEARQLLPSLPEGGLLAGFLGYEAGRWCERMPARPEAGVLPDVYLRPTAGHLVHHTRTGEWSIHGSAAFQAEAHTLLSAASEAPPTWEPQAAVPLHGPAEAYMGAVRNALSQIHDGEVYQVNLAWEARAPALPQPLATWLTLRRDNPARRGAFFQVDRKHSIASNSPELFLEITRDHDGLRATSTPIKGTVRQADGTAGRRHLETSAKERAELTMIVDLVRNDLGRVAPWGGVEVSDRVLTDCGDLVHAEQTVQARVRPELDAIDVVNACFPPGSVTGAPKVRALSLIHELEPVRRGVYTGAIGFFDRAGCAHLNVAIRTLTCAPAYTSFHVGAGIVADSDPRAEWEETRAKGRLINAVLSGSMRGENT